MIRAILDQIADKWAMLLLAVLNEPRRFNAIKRRLDGITQRVLTQTLRRLERNGMVTRRILPGPPLGVAYSLTPLGRSLQNPFAALYDWMVEHMGTIPSFQKDYVARGGSSGRGVVFPFSRRHKFSNQPSPGLGHFDVADPVENGIARGALETSEERRRLRVGVKRGLEISWNLRGAGRRVGGIPSSVDPRRINLGQAGGLYVARIDQFDCPRPINLRPSAGALARREPDQPARIVVPVLLPVDPAITQRSVDRFCPRDASQA